MTEKHPLSQQETLANNIASVQQQIAAAARRAGRQPAEITLVAVSKTQPLALLEMAYQLGVRDFGENRVQEALTKMAEWQQWQPPDLHWHMIGHLQSNKVSKIAGHFACIQSIDSLRLAETLNRHHSLNAEHNRRQAVLLEVNIAGEASKTGISEAESLSLAQQIATLAHLEIQGLMTIAPRVDDAEKVRPVFRALRTLSAKLQQALPQCNWQHLSMGMTDDYHVAIEEGATIVRIGRAIFGERVKKGEINEI